MESSRVQLRLSRIVHQIGSATSRSSASAIVAITVLIAFVVLASTGFPSIGVSVFATTISAVTVIMLFVIQHTQSREQKATQLKLDELIRASPEADNLLMHIEVAEDVELIEREAIEIAHHALIREEEIANPSEIVENEQ